MQHDKSSAILPRKLSANVDKISTTGHQGFWRQNNSAIISHKSSNLSNYLAKIHYKTFYATIYPCTVDEGVFKTNVFT